MSNNKGRVTLDQLIENCVPLEPVPNLNRLTYYFSFVHQSRGEAAQGIQVSGTLIADTKEEVFSRRLEVSAEPKSIPTKWIDNSANIGFISIQNLAGLDLEVNPTAEEAKVISDSIVVLYYDDPSKGILVPPGYPQILLPTAIDKLLIKSLNGNTFNYRMTLFPR